MVGTTPSEEHWAEAVQWRPFVYSRLAKFGARVMRRAVSWGGEIGTPTFQWQISPGVAYGVDPTSLMQDLEPIALEAAARAAQRFDPGREVKFVTYLAKVVDNALHDEFAKWVQSSASMFGASLEDAEGLEELGEPESSLTPAIERALTEAMGRLTSREAWALRMYADDTPIDVIRDRMGHDHRQSTHALIKRAKEKAAPAFEQSLEEAAGE